MSVQCRVARSLGKLEGTHQEVWGTKEYTDPTQPCVFMGMYGLPDFYTLWNHIGKKYIIWCGTDITHFLQGYWLNKEGNIHLYTKPLAEWIDKYCESWVENKVEQAALKAAGVRAKVCPSFMGQIKDFP